MTRGARMPGDCPDRGGQKLREYGIDDTGMHIGE
jgi:hypothetical protein